MSGATNQGGNRFNEFPEKGVLQKGTGINIARMNVVSIPAWHARVCVRACDLLKCFQIPGGVHANVQKGLARYFELI